jgi:hypothetical protein
MPTCDEGSPELARAKADKAQGVPSEAGTYILLRASSQQESDGIHPAARLWNTLALLPPEKNAEV